MLKSIPAIITPELLYSLAAMGHGDQLAIVDRNYPALARNPRVHALSGVGTTQAAAAICELFPIDDFGQPAAYRMTPDDDPYAEFEAHREFAEVLHRAEARPIDVRALQRTPFYTLAATAYAIVQTSEPRPFACFVLTKGVIRSTDPRITVQ